MNRLLMVLIKVIIKSKVTRTLCNAKFNNGMHVSVNEIADAIKNMKRGKSSGSDGLTGEAFMYLGQRLHMILSLRLTSVLIYGYLAKYTIDSIIVPFVKTNMAYSMIRISRFNVCSPNNQEGASVV